MDYEKLIKVNTNPQNIEHRIFEVNNSIVVNMKEYTNQIIKVVVTYTYK